MRVSSEAMAVFHIGASIDVQIKAMASYPLWRTMESLSIGPSGSSTSGKRGCYANLYEFSQESHMNCVLSSSTNSSPCWVLCTLVDVRDRTRGAWV